MSRSGLFLLFLSYHSNSPMILIFSIIYRNKKLVPVITATVILSFFSLSLDINKMFLKKNDLSCYLETAKAKLVS